MIPIFDLDDTLYPERSYVDSGFRVVAQWGAAQFGWPEAASFECLRKLLDRHGRGKIFDLWLKDMDVRATRLRVEEAVRIYRHHRPNIKLPPQHRAVLEALAKSARLYLVTDGHKVVQANKIAALRIAPLFAGIYITHRYGLSASKPSPRCFELIRNREGVAWSDMVYVGDNPAKDFVTLNRFGMPTVRVLTGHHANDIAAPGYEAAYRIEQLTKLPTLLKGIKASR